MEHSSWGYWISICWNHVGKRQDAPHLFSCVTKKISLSISPQNLLAEEQVEASGRSETLPCMFCFPGELFLTEVIPAWVESYQTHCACHHPRSAGCASPWHYRFSYHIIQAAILFFCDNWGKWLLWVCQKRTPGSNSPCQPTSESRGVYNWQD